MCRETFEANLLQWMNDNKFIIGIHPEDEVAQRKTSLSIIKWATRAMDLFIDVPLHYKVGNWLDSFGGSEEEIASTLGTLASNCNILGTRPIDGRIIAIIYADSISHTDLESKFENLFNDASKFKNFLTRTTACFVNPLVVFFDSANFDFAVKTLFDKGWKSAGMFENRYMHAAFIDCQRKTIEYAEAKGFIGAAIKRGISIQTSSTGTGKFFAGLNKQLFGSECRTYLTNHDIRAFLGHGFGR